MKRVIPIIALLLCFVLLTACDAVELLSEVGEHISALEGNEEATALDTPLLEPSVPQDPAASATDTDAQPEEDFTPTDAPDDESDSETDEPEPEPEQGEAQPDEAETDPGIDYTALSAADCVEDAWPQSPGVMPRITVECAGADMINDLILSEFGPHTQEPGFTVHYETFKNNRVLSVLMVVETDFDFNMYTPYNLDLATGSMLTGPELLQLLAQDPNELIQLETAVLSEEFIHQFGQFQDETDEFYDQQYARTTDISNADTQNIWLGDYGQLYFVGRVYGLAGAEYYAYPLGSGLYFQ